MIQLTPSAVTKLQEILSDEPPEMRLRVFVAGGGCSGFTQGFTLDSIQNDDDLEVDANGVKVLVDVLSAQYLEGATVDFTSDLRGDNFVIRNPQAVTTCGCGASFNI